MCASVSQSEQDIQYSEKLFHFTDESDIIELSCSSSDSLCFASEQHVCGDSCLNVKISEVLNPDFGMYIWPCAPVLGKYIWNQRQKICGKIVLELGAGTGLSSVVAAKCGAHVIITDSKRYKSVLKHAENNMQLNNIGPDEFEMMDITWGKFSPYLINIGEIDVVLGSDVFYDPADFEDVIVTLSYIMKRNPKAEFWCTYEHRCSDWNVSYFLEKWNLKCTEVPLKNFGADKFNVAGSDLPGLKTISCFIITYSLPLSM